MTADELASVTLEHLRAIRTTQSDHTERFARLESRINSLEPVIAGMRRDLRCTATSWNSTPASISSPPASNASNAGWN
jgi:hypothetical protein